MRNLKGHSIRKLRTTVLDAQVYVRHTNTRFSSRPQRDLVGNRSKNRRITENKTEP